jgi:hypothetical protein
MTVEELQERFQRKIAEASRGRSTTSEAPGGNMESGSSEESRGLEDQPSQTSIGVAEATDEEEEYRLCPKCRGAVYRRSRRRWWERMMKRPKMARCMKCDHRFPYPH